MGVESIPIVGDFIVETVQTLKRMNYRQLITQAVQLGEALALPEASP